MMMLGRIGYLFVHLFHSMYLIRIAITHIFSQVILKIKIYLSVIKYTNLVKSTSQEVQMNLYGVQILEPRPQIFTKYYSRFQFRTVLLNTLSGRWILLYAAIDWWLSGVLLHTNFSHILYLTRKKLFFTLHFGFRDKLSKLLMV